MSAQTDEYPERFDFLSASSQVSSPFRTRLSTSHFNYNVSVEEVMLADT